MFLVWYNTESWLRKTLLRKIALWIIPPIGALLIRLIFLLSKKKYHIPQTIPSEPVIFVFWHGNLLMLIFMYRYLRQNGHLKLMISEHFDGELIAKIIERFGSATIRGSSKRGGAKALMQGLKSLSEGGDVGITPDGPKGPRHSVSDGTVYMAQKKRAQIIGLTCIPSRYWEVSSWDKFVIPKPFGTLEFHATEPFSIDGFMVEDAKVIIYKHLRAFTL